MAEYNWMNRGRGFRCKGACGQQFDKSASRAWDVKNKKGPICEACAVKDGAVSDSKPIDFEGAGGAVDVDITPVVAAIEAMHADMTARWDALREEVDMVNTQLAALVSLMSDVASIKNFQQTLARAVDAETSSEPPSDVQNGVDFSVPDEVPDMFKRKK